MQYFCLLLGHLVRPDTWTLRSSRKENFQKDCSGSFWQNQCLRWYPGETYFQSFYSLLFFFPGSIIFSHFVHFIIVQTRCVKPVNHRSEVWDDKGTMARRLIARNQGPVLASDWSVEILLAFWLAHSALSNMQCILFTKCCLAQFLLKSFLCNVCNIFLVANFVRV